MTSILTALALLTAAQDDVYRTLELGNRVQVTFHSGNTMTGNLVVIPKSPDEKVTKVDYTKVTELTLNISWEYPGLNGTMTIRKDQIKSVRKLRALDPATLKRLQEEKQKAMAELKKREDARQAFEADRLKKAQDGAKKRRDLAKAQDGNKDDVQRLENLKKGLELLAKYPPPDWGPQRLQAIQQKNLARVPMSAEERDFVANIELWMLAYNYRKRQSQNQEQGGGPGDP